MADLYRGWYQRRGVNTNRLLIETFVLIEPWWSAPDLRTPALLAGAAVTVRENLRSSPWVADQTQEPAVQASARPSGGGGVPRA